MAIVNKLQVFDEQGNQVDYDILASDVKFSPDGKDLPTKLAEMEEEIGEGGYTPPAGGIPKSDLAPSVQTSLGLADTALQEADKTQLQNAINSLQSALDTLIGSGNVQGAIDTFNEVKAFLEGISSSDTLAAKLATLVPQSRTINGKTLDSNIDIGINDIQGLAAALANAGGANVSVETDEQGAITINVGTDSYVIDLNHTHEAMAKLRLYTQATMPQAKALDTIYAQVDNVGTPTEIQKLFIAGCEFEKGWLPDNGEAVIKSPSNGTTIDLGEIDQGSVSKTIIVRGWNLTGALTVAIGGTGLSMNYGNLTGQSSITIPQAAALTGAEVEIEYSGTDDLYDGALVISQGNDVLSAVVVTAETIILPTGYTKLSYLDCSNIQRGIDTGIKATTASSISGTSTLGSVWEIDMEGVNNGSTQYVLCTNENVGHFLCVWNGGKCGLGGSGGNFAADSLTRRTYQISFYSNKSVATNGLETLTKDYTTPNNYNVCLLRNINAIDSQYSGFSYRGKIYSIKCNSGGSFEGIPARRNSDNAIGLYDIENNVFHSLS